jgi:hypothetical protein
MLPCWLQEGIAVHLWTSGTHFIYAKAIICKSANPRKGGKTIIATK